MAHDKMARLRLLMQKENVPEAPVEVPNSLERTTNEQKPNPAGCDAQGEKFRVKAEENVDATSAAEHVPDDSIDQQAPRQQSKVFGNHGGSSSSDDYPVRKTPLASSKKQSKVRKSRPLHRPVGQADELSTIKDLGCLGIGYCPILAVAKYPYKFMKGSAALTEQVACNFFSAAKFWDRKWTLHFIYPPSSVSLKPLLLVPVEEVETLLAEINNTLDLRLQLPPRANERGLLLEFSADGQPQPRLLGSISSQAEFKAMASNISNDSMNSSSASYGAHHSFIDYERMMTVAVQATNPTKKASQEKRKFKRLERKEDIGRSLRRTQRYLGLRPRSKSDIWSFLKPPSPYDYAGRFEEYVKAKAEHERKVAERSSLPALNLSASNPFPFDLNVVFVSLDVEAYERNHNQITEIGISTLDTADLIGIAPKSRGTQWMTKIRARHFRITENQHRVNKDFVIGCPDRFERSFGSSEFISVKEAPKVVASCFKPPFSALRTKDTIGAEEQSEGIRNLILVGHDTKTDVKYLRDLGYDVGNLSNLKDILDTAELYSALKREDQTASLGQVLLDLKLDGWNLHNAGNDAAYTMQAMIAIAIKALTLKDAEEQMDFFEKGITASGPNKAMLLEEAEEWRAASGSDDGGVALLGQQGASTARGVMGGSGGAGGSDDGPSYVEDLAGLIL
ncbi:hypothetical protein MMC13_003692 [Lambiella insularis]|nr:hypothetical protein [Lambiella insularis]